MTQTRQLAAIMFTDIVGYTALMGEDEHKAFELLQKNRNLQKPIIEKYNGRWIKELGDGVIATFNTVSDAVYAAKEIQEQCKETGEFSLRIGIHQGEIVFQNDDVFGDTVNICSRIQVLAPVGGILISEHVYKNISNNRTIKTQFWGEEVLKHVREPVRIYEIVDKTSVTETQLRTIDQRRKTKKVFSIKWLALTGIIILLLAALGFGYWSYSKRNTNQISSIAILPFENRSTDPDTEYLSDGLAESLIYRLSQLPNLKVSPSSSVIRFKGKETDIQKIGDELGVTAMMFGRIVQRGDNLTISVELVDVRNTKLLWGEQYQRKTSELLATQREIANEIAQKLHLKLSGDERGLTKHFTNNNEAYQLYLKGRYHFAKRTKVDMLRSIEYFQQSIRLDPNFALSYASIAECYNQMPSYPYLSSKESFPQAKDAAQRALKIDPTLSEAHTALANYFAIYEWNWAEAERAFKRAIEFNHSNSDAHFRYGQFYLSPLGRHDEAITELKQAVELEPLSLIMNAVFAEVYTFARHKDQALEQAHKTYDLEPNFPVGGFALGLAYISNGMYEKAIDLSKKVLQSDSTSQFMLQVAGYSYAKTGRRGMAEEVIRRFKNLSKSQYVMSYFVAVIYAALGDNDKAFAEIEKAFAEREWILYRLKVDPLMDQLHKDPRFREMLKRMNLPE